MDGSVSEISNHVSCRICVKKFDSSDEFRRHLRKEHCTQEGGSFVCRYGDNEVCSSLPVEGVNDVDYERHIVKHHIYQHHKRHRRCSMVSSFSSDHIMDGDKWTIYSASQNLSAVLNNPAKPKQKDFFTKLWGDSFVEVTKIPPSDYLPTVTRSHFESYLRKIAKRYRRHSRIQHSINSDSQNELLQNFPTLRTLKSAERINFDTSEIPQLFLKTKFDLSCPEIFNAVFPHISECIIPDSTSIVTTKNNCSFHPRSLSTSSKSLQEKLSHYLDIVEVQIAKQVAGKAGAFFHTMTSHDALMEQLGQTISKVHVLRNKIQKIDNNLVVSSLRVLKGVRARNNNSLVLHKLKIMATVYQTQPTVKLLLSTPDYVAALDLIYTTKDLLNNEIAGIQCFRHLSSELNEMINTIDTLMTEEFDRYAGNDLNRPLTDSETQVMEVDKLFCIVLGMLRRECFSFVDSYVKESNTTIKAVIKQAVVDVVSESESPILHGSSSNDSLSLDDQLKLLSIEEWITLLRNTATYLIHLLDRIKSMYDVMLEAVNVCAGKVPMFSSNGDTSCQKSFLISDNVTEQFLDEENYNIVVKKLSTLMISPCQHALERYSYLISQRSLLDVEETEELKAVSNSSPNNKIPNSNSWLMEQATQLQLREVSQYVENLCLVCEDLCHNDSVPKILRSVFKTEVGKFMLRFHYERLTKISLILESEGWCQTDVPCEFQQLVDQIYKSGKFVTYKPDPNSNIDNKPGKILRVGDEKFVVIGTVLLLINMVAEYCVRAEDITLSAGSLLRYVAELLHSFNSKSCRLVLGAEAVSEKTGKKKITSANLALLLRALQLLLWLIPKIKAHFRNLLSRGSSVSSLDRVSDEIRTHIKDINAKLISIVSQIITDELKMWEAKPPVPSKAFQKISRYLCKLYEAVSTILTKDDLCCLYRNINIAFKDILREKITRMNIVNNGGPQHGLVTQELVFYIEDLKKVSALPKEELNLESMEDIWS